MMRRMGLVRDRRDMSARMRWKERRQLHVSQHNVMDK